MSSKAWKLINKMLQKNPINRISASEALLD